MIRLLIWFFRYIVVGQKLLPKPRCLRAGASNHDNDLPASSICGTGLCVRCCEGNCKCIMPLIKQTMEAR